MPEKKLIHIDLGDWPKFPVPDDWRAFEPPTTPFVFVNDKRYLHGFSYEVDEDLWFALTSAVRVFRENVEIVDNSRARRKSEPQT